ncbi:MAG: phosphoglucosamine mutase [Acidobacteria bacterium]|nr:phosphoglucosamine mutase [Acidobacteriota bacterium]
MTHPLSLKIGITGVRGIAGQSLTPQLVTSFAAAFGTYCGSGPVIIGTDTRPSREMVTHAAIAGLLSVGCTPVSLGIVPLPVLQHHVRRTAAVGGICITASHNPLEWNALKFVGPDGMALRPNQFAELTDLYHQGVYPRVTAQRITNCQTDDSAIAAHRETVLTAVNEVAIRSRHFKAALDCCNGAASAAAPEFLRALGCEVVPIHTEPEKGFPRDPEPIAENIDELRRLVKEAGAEVGFALDADGDRLALVNERGEALGEDCTIALVADHALGRRGGPVVVSMSTSRLVEDAAARHNSVVYRTKVGEVHVLERMYALGSRVGGEGNGGVILPAINPCRDSFVGMAFVLEALAENRAKLSELRNRLPAYSMIKQKLGCRSRDVLPFLRLVRHLFRDEEMDLTDGVRVLWPDRWIHVRGSNTESVIRIIAEAPTEADARQLVQRVMEYLRPPEV